MAPDERVLLATLQHLPVAAIVADADGRVVFANVHVEATLGLSVDHIESVDGYAALGVQFPDGTPLGAADFPIVRALRGEIVPASDYRYQHPDGRMVWIRGAAAPISDTDGAISGASFLFRNVDREREDETRLRVAERRLNLAMKTARLGAWTLDLATFHLTCTAGCKANFGLPADAPFDYPDFLAAIHPDDRDRVRTRVEDAIASGGDYICEYRTIWPDGSVHWIAARGRAEYGEHGAALSMDGVTGEITEQRELEQMLRAQADALRDADRRKDQFLAALSHELRNPMQALSSAASVLRLQHDGSPASGRALDILERQLSQMTRLVDDLLEVSRISEGKIRLEIEALDAASIVGAAVEAMRPRIESRQQRLAIERTGAPVVVEGDAQRLTQVIVNLLNNASKYTDANGDIIVSVRARDTDAEISVRDTGVGIPPELQPYIFEPFMQVDAHRGRSEGGLGLGLSLVERLTKLHGGSVSVHSKGVGLGSEFVVRLPLLLQPATT